MPNPFDIAKPVEWETVEGSFACERCPRWLTTARYHVGEKLLVWKCECGHISKIIKDLEVD